MRTIYIEKGVNLTGEARTALTDIITIFGNQIDANSEVEVYWAHPSTPVTPEIMKRFPNCRYIVSNTTSTDFIVKGYRPITISLEKHPCLREITSTAEHALGLIMALHRNILPAHTEVVGEDIWDRGNWIAPRMLSDMTLCIYGYGRLGKMLNKIATPIFKEIIAIDRHSSETAIKRTLAEADIISLHVTPIKGDMQPIFGIWCLAHMKNDALLVNTSRAEILDHNYLLNMLETGSMRGAALDTLPGEFQSNFSAPHSVSERLMEYCISNNNLIITPHIGGSTQDALDITQLAVIKQLKERIQKDEDMGIYTGEGRKQEHTSQKSLHSEQKAPIKLCPGCGQPIPEPVLHNSEHRQQGDSRIHGNVEGLQERGPDTSSGQARVPRREQLKDTGRDNRLPFNMS